MAGAGEEPRQLACVERRRRQHEVVEMAGAHPGVVGDVDVSLPHRLDREGANEMLHALGHGVDVAGCARHGLCQHVALAIEDAGGEVSRLAHDGRKGRAQQHLRLLLNHRDQAVPHDLQLDLGEPAHGGHFPFLLADLPAGLAAEPAALRAVSTRPYPASISASKAALTRVEVPDSTMMAGPFIRVPGTMPRRSYIGTFTARPDLASNTGRVPIGFGANLARGLPNRAGFAASVVTRTAHDRISMAARGMCRAKSWRYPASKRSRMAEMSVSASERAGSGTAISWPWPT